MPESATGTHYLTGRRVARSGLDERAVALRFRLDAKRVPPKCLTHQLGHAVCGRDAVLDVLIVSMKAADQHVFHRLCQLPADCVDHLGFDG